MANETLSIRKRLAALAYRACFAEFVTDALLARWRLFDNAVGVLTAVTASSSAIAGWQLWSRPSGKETWTLFAGAAVLLSVFHSVLAAKGRIQNLERIRRNLLDIRIECQMLLNEVSFGLSENKALIRFMGLSGKLERAKADVSIARFWPSKRVLILTQQRVNEAMADYIGVDHEYRENN